MQYDQLSTMISRQAEHYGDRTCLKYKSDETGTWIPVSWNRVDEIIKLEAQAMAALGIGVQENVGIFSQNMPEYIYTDFAAYANRAVNVPLYATSSPSQVKYIVENANIRVLFVGEQYQYDTAFDVLPHCATLEHIVIFDSKVKKSSTDKGISMSFDEFLMLGAKVGMDKVVEERSASSCLNDLACLMYTSGTTGTPKGVKLTHLCFQQALKNHDKLIDFKETDVSLNFLPFTHVFEKAWVYLCLHHGVTTCVNLRPQEVQEAMKEVRPTMMCSVPRFWEKIYAGVQEKIRTTTGVQKSLMEDAITVGMKYNAAIREHKRPPLWVRTKYAFYQRTIYKLLKKTIGLDNGRLFPIGGAKIPDLVHEFATAVGMPILIGYGLTESTASVTVTNPNDYKIGSVGKLMSDIELKFGENNEIYLRGNTITPGYYNNVEATTKAIDENGWFHTGDAGYMDENGNLFLTERLKELFKTSNGKYIAPQSIESNLVVDRFIDQIVIIADQRKYVSALIVPDFSQLEKWAQVNTALATLSREELVRHAEVKKLFYERIETLQQHFAHFEMVKKFTLLPDAFTMEKGEMTNTLKIKRAVVYQHYKDVIESMYQE